MSNSSAEPALSVVIGANAPASSLEACLAALEPQVDAAEVIVSEGVPSPADLRDRFSWARFIERRGALVPELWRDGIDQSRGHVVAITIAQMIPAPDWVETILAQHRHRDVVAGAIEPGPGLRLADWAEYFCRYSRDMLPFPARENVELPGDNAAYKRHLLEQTRELYRDGFWEPVVHWKLAAEGVVLWHAPELVVRQGRSSGWRAFARQRLDHARSYGQQRGARFGKGRNVAQVLGSPLVPFLMTWRILREVMSRGRYRGRAVAALPLAFFFNLVWAVAEARGHLDSLRAR